MIQDTSELLYKYKEYKVPYQKIMSLIEKEELLSVKRGLYETDPEIPGYVLANDILGPSYLSFEWALSYYGMIPERVHIYTSASFDLKKNKKFENVFGIYTYQDVPKHYDNNRFPLSMLSIFCMHITAHYTLSGGGFGHGIGFSQYGADKLAKAGSSYKDIIGYYLRM